jgi:hypothetical protein
MLVILQPPQMMLGRNMQAGGLTLAEVPPSSAMHATVHNTFSWPLHAINRMPWEQGIC